MDNEKAVVRLPSLTDRPKESYLPKADTNEIKSLVHYKMDNIIHKLPRPQILKPYIDMKTADIELWPSHASTQNCGHKVTKLTRSKSLQLITTESLGKSNFIPQPKLLENLEAYLKEELAFIDDPDEEDSNISLEVYRKTFNYLINKLKTYKHLLSRIKVQYEMALDDLESQIISLKPLKETVVSTAEIYEKKIIEFNEQVKPDIKAVKNQNSDLEEEIELMKEKLVQIEEERKEAEDKLKDAYQLFRDEYDAQQLLSIEYKELSILQSGTQSPSDSNKPEEPTEDLSTLKIALSQSVEDADATQAKLDQMIADYADVVPRRQYEALEKRYGEMKENNETLSKDFSILKAEHKALQDVNQELTVEMTNYMNDYTSKKKTFAKPPWVKPCQFINPDDNQFEVISSQNICEILLDILRNMDKNGARILKKESLYFDGKGLSEDVPKYLRYEGQVYNRQFSKRDCALLIKDIWRRRIKNFKKGSSFADFVDNCLNEIFPIPIMKTEWTYNLVDACKIFADTNKNIELFWLILNGEMDENIYHYQLSVLKDLLNFLYSSLSPQNVMKRTDFHQHLQTFLNSNDPKIITSLVNKALEEQEAEENITFDQLFLEDDEGEMGPFLTEFKNLLHSLRMEFFELVSKEIDEESQVSIQNLDLAIRQTDPTLKTYTVKELLCWCFRTTPEMLLRTKPLLGKDILLRLRNANIRFSQIKTSS